MTNLRTLLSNNVKRRRKTLGISQAILAEKIGTSAHYIAQIEQENKFPSAEMLERIAAALEFDSAELFSKGPFPEEAIKQFHEGIKADIDAIYNSIEERMEKLINSNIES